MRSISLLYILDLLLSYIKICIHFIHFVYKKKIQQNMCHIILYLNFIASSFRRCLWEFIFFFWFLNHRTDWKSPIFTRPKNRLHVLTREWLWIYQPRPIFPGHIWRSLFLKFYHTHYKYNHVHVYYDKFLVLKNKPLLFIHIFSFLSIFNLILPVLQLNFHQKFVI